MEIRLRSIALAAGVAVVPGERVSPVVPVARRRGSIGGAGTAARRLAGLGLRRLGEALDGPGSA